MLVARGWGTRSQVELDCEAQNSSSIALTQGGSLRAEQIVLGSTRFDLVAISIICTTRVGSSCNFGRVIIRCQGLEFTYVLRVGVISIGKSTNKWASRWGSWWTFKSGSIEETEYVE